MNDEDIEHWAVRADAARDLACWGEAARLYKIVLQRDPSRTALWVQLGHSLKELGDPSEAKKAYFCALKINPELPDAWLELLTLGLSRDEVLKGLGIEPPRNQQLAQCFFTLDITDLISHLQHNHSPTGIQRVQLQLVAAILVIENSSEAVFYDENLNGWIHISRELFGQIFFLQAKNNKNSILALKEVRSKIQYLQKFAGRIEFEFGAILLNLGTSWAWRGYKEAIQNMRNNLSLRYYTFVHDVIPLQYPNLCDSGLSDDFRAWFDWALTHAEGLLVASNAVKLDICGFAHNAGSLVMGPVPLNGPFLNGRVRSRRLRPYVLMVATLERRKNHLLVFEAWERLIRERGLLRVPLLRCVGKEGNASEAIKVYLQARPQLLGAIEMVGPISDQDLAALYSGCEFVLCPSKYEGWGLPLSEALSMGKPVIASKVGAHPEVGGRFAQYFSVDSTEELCRSIKNWLDVPLARNAAELRNRVFYRPRSWRDIAKQMLDVLGLTSSQSV